MFVFIEIKKIYFLFIFRKGENEKHRDEKETKIIQSIIKIYIFIYLFMRTFSFYLYLNRKLKKKKLNINNYLQINKQTKIIYVNYIYIAKFDIYKMFFFFELNLPCRFSVLLLLLFLYLFSNRCRVWN